MAEYYVAWGEDDNPKHLAEDFKFPTWYRVWRVNLGGRDEAVTDPMLQHEALETMRRIKLLDQPAQKELDL